MTHDRTIKLQKTRRTLRVKISIVVILNEKVHV